MKRCDLPIVSRLCLLATLSFIGVPDGKAEETAGGTNDTSTQPSYRWAGTFEGTFAYDRDVGYDYGRGDDSGRSASFYRRNRGKANRMPGKRPDPGDYDYADFYYQSVLTNDGRRDDDDDDSHLKFPGQDRRERYRHSHGFIPLRYGDFPRYQRFEYELGGSGVE